jgi:histidinol-phosphatase (PHP family)
MNLATISGRFNLHTHSTWCDGKSTPEEMIQAALAQDLTTLGFSSHAMLPYDDIDWVLTTEKLPRYIDELRTLQAKYQDQICILIGVEGDYIPGASEPSTAVYGKYGVDYIIGSVHEVVAPDGAWVHVDASPEELKSGLEAHYKGDARAFITDYFREIRTMIQTCDFDILGHLDLVRKFNEKHPYFDETAPWYLEEVRATLETLAATNKILEVNTGGMARGWTTDAYPAAHLREMIHRDFPTIPLILSSDAHSAAALTFAFDTIQL